MKPHPTLEELKDADFQIWRRNPITAVYLQFLQDQAASFRAAALELWEVGQLDPNSPNPQINSNMLRGRVLCLQELHGLQLGSIKDFYSQAEQEENQA